MNTNIYRVNREELLNRLRIWDGFLGRKVHLIACGGTALTLLGIKDSTKDIDFMVPKEEEYAHLMRRLKQMGYNFVSGAGLSAGDGFVFDIFKGNKVHTIELLESPLEEGNNIQIVEFERIYLGVLNYYDLIITKLFRGTSVDFDDCLMLVNTKRNEIELKKLEKRFQETASFEISEKKVNKNLIKFLEILKEEPSNEKQ